MYNLLNRKFYSTSNNILGSLFFLVIFSGQLSAHMDNNTTKKSRVYNDKTTLLEIQERMSDVSSIIDIEVTPEVHERINQYTYHSRRSAEKLLNRVLIYFPIFEKEIRRRGMPDEVKYLAVVESMLDPNATSKSGATGLWQFVKGTAEMVGLEVNEVVDERRSIEKSTQAAMDYLQSLYDRFGDWNLAIAAYNCGPGNVNKAIKRSGKKDFWEIRKFLPNETQKYLPRFIAAMYLLNNYHYHGFAPSLVNSEFSEPKSFQMKKRIRLSQIAKDIGSDYNTLSKLNPQYIQGYIPASHGKYNVSIPGSKVGNFYKAYDMDKYNSLLLERKIKEDKKIKRLTEVVETNTLLSRDTLQPIEQIVSLIYSSIQSMSRKRNYHIPRKMRSLESVLKRV